MGGERAVSIVTSNRTEALARELAARVRGERDDAGPFEPVTIVVPTATIRAFLEFELARRLGICAQVDFLHWSSFVDRLGGGDRGASAPDAVQAALVGALDDPVFLDGDDAEPARRYVESVRGDDARAVRRVQLARRLARLFDAYAVHRPDLIAAWRADVAASVDSRVDAIERMERALWRRVFVVGPDAARMRVLGQADAIDASVVPPVVHVFGFSYLGRAYHDLLVALGATARVHVYALHPCVEFRTDLDGLDAPDSVGPLPDPPGPDPLFGGVELGAHGTIAPVADWARAGRSNLDLLLERGGDALVSVARYERPAGDREPTVLERLQQAILFRTPAAERVSSPVAVDESVRVFACPDARREVEAVAADIWRRVDAGVRFHEIGVVVNPAKLDAVQAHVESVFADAHGIPHTLLDVPAEHASRVVDGVRRLLELPTSAFTRADVLGVLGHPTFEARHPGGDPARWLRWCDATGVLYGIDRGALDGSYVERDLYSFDQGVRRVVLGAFLGPTAEPAFALGDERYLPEPVTDAGDAAHFAVAVRSLLADADHARRARMPLARWAEFLGDYVSAYVAAENEDDDEAHALERCRTAIARLAAIDVDGRPVDYRTASSFVLQSLATLTASRGRPLADGVTISSFQPMRAIPFRVLYVVGLDEGTFPGNESRDPLDLRLASRRAGDVRAPERDRFMFLEAVLSARDALVLTYGNRDPATQAERPPSSVVGELLWTLERTVVGAAARELIVAHPVDRHADDYAARPALALVTPIGDAERDARRLGEALAAHCATRAVVRPPVAALPNRLAAPARGRVARALVIESPPGRSPKEAVEPRRVTVTLSAIRRFLDNPLQGWARDVLRLVAFDADDPLGERDEAFAAQALARTVALRDVLAATSRADAVPIDVAYDRAIARHEAAGDAPTALFQRVERRAHLALVERWRADLVDVGLGGPLVAHAFGSAPVGEPDAIRHPAIELDATWDVDGAPVTHRVTITGTAGPIVDGDAGTVVAVTRDFAEARDWVRGWVDAHALRAVDRGADAYRIAVVGGKKTRTVTLAPPSSDAARAWFAAIVADMHGRAHDYRLSARAVLRARMREEPLVDAARAADREASRFDPVRHVAAYDPPDDATASAFAALRYGDLFDRVVAS